VRRYIRPLATNAAVTLSRTMLDDFVFVTAASDIFFKRSIFLIARIQQFFPKKVVIYYDLGLRPSQQEEVIMLD
jgi:hypothetical protein